MGEYADLYKKVAGQNRAVSAATPTPTYFTKSPDLYQAVQSANQAVSYSRPMYDAGTQSKAWEDIKAIAAGKRKRANRTDSVWDVLKNVGGKALQGITYVTGTPGRVVASTLKEISDIPSGRASLMDWAKQVADPTTATSKYLPKTGTGWLDGILGFAADVGTDPLLFIGTAPISALSRGGRIATAARAGEMTAVAPEMLGKLDDIVRYAHNAKLDNLQREVLDLQKGFRWNFGENKLLFDPASKAGRASAAVATAVSVPAQRMRAVIGDIGWVNKVQGYVRPRTYGGSLNALGRGQNLDPMTVLTELINYSAGIRGKAGKAVLRQVALGENSPLVQGLERNPYRETVYEVIDALDANDLTLAGRAVPEEEVNLAREIMSLRDNARNEVNATVDEFNARRGVDAYRVGFVEGYGVPRSMTPEAQAVIRDPSFSTKPYSREIAETLDMSASEFARGPAVMKARKLEKGSKFLGETLQTNTVKEINDISERVLGVKWFKTDAASVLNDYVDGLANQAARIAYVDRVFDYGLDMVAPLVRRMIPDSNLMAPLEATILQLKSAQRVASNIADRAERVGRAQAGKLVGRGEEEIAKRAASRAATENEVRELGRIAFQARAALNEARTRAESSQGEIRQAFMEVLGPLEARVQELERTLASGTAREDAATSLLKSLHVRAFPEIDDAMRPTTYNELAQQLYDAADIKYTAKEAELLARQQAGEDVTRNIGASKGVLTKEQNKVAAQLDEIRSARASIRGKKGELKTAKAELSKEQKRLSKLLQDDPLLKEVATAEKKHIRTVNALDSKQNLLASKQEWDKVVRPALQDAIDEVRNIDDVTRLGAESLTDAGRKAMNELDRILRRGVGLGASTSPIPEGVRHAAEYAARLGREYADIPPQTLANPAITERIASAYKALPEGVPPVGSPDYNAYMALKKEIKEQYKYLTEDLGIKVEFTLEDPYEDAADMVKDILVNKRLKVYYDYLDHPMLGVDAETGIHENGMFRAVHDYFGHAAGGSRFDRNGEEIAFLRHIQMFSDEASAAAASELRGQNSVLIVDGEFPIQKAYLLPEELRRPSNTMGQFIDDLSANGGVTIDITGREVVPPEGFVVGLGGRMEFGIPASEITYKDDFADRLIAPFLANPDVRKELMKKNRWLGAWYDEDNDLYWIGVSQIYADKSSAVKALLKNNQLAAYDLGRGGDLYTINGIIKKERLGRKLSPQELEFKNGYAQKVEDAKRGGGNAEFYRRPVGGTEGAFGPLPRTAEQATRATGGEQALGMGGRRPVEARNVSQETSRIGDLAETIRNNRGISRGNASQMRKEWVSRTDEMLGNINNSRVLTDPQKDALRRNLMAAKAAEVDLANIEQNLNVAEYVADQWRRFPEQWGGVMVNDIKEGWVALNNLGVQIPKQLSDLLFGRVELLASGDGIRQFLKYFDSYNRFFKVSAMLTPGFIVRNAMTAAFNNFVFGCTPQDIADGIRFATLLRTKGPKKALASFPPALRKEYIDAWESVLASGGGQTLDIITQPVGKGKPSRFLNTKVVRGWSKLNEDTEVAARMAMALRSIRRGSNIDQTAASIALFHFDYGDQSKMDENAKNFVPFWTFASRNIPLQIQMMMSRSGPYRAYEALRRQMPVDENLILPYWLSRRGPLGAGGGGVINPDLPFIDLEEQINKLSDPLELLSQLYPQYRLPIELAGKRKLGLNVPFSENPQQVRGPLDYPAALVGALFGQTTTTPEGLAITEPVSYALSSLLPTLQQFQRYVPQAGGPEKYQERQLSSLLGAVGVPYRAVTQEEQQRELTGRELAIQRYLADLRRRGYIEPQA